MNGTPRANESGQGIVEFAVIFPLFIMLIFVMIDGGLLMGSNSRVNHAVDEAARYAATGATTGGVLARLEDQSGGRIDDSYELGCSETAAREVCIRWHPSSDANVGEVGSWVMVKVHYHYYLVTPMDSMARMLGSPGGLGLDSDDDGVHFSMDPCTIVMLERPADLDGDDETSNDETPTCGN